ncbi:hypothetical protein E4N62_09085 [Streptomyces sp. MNU76]|uniref:hypothetical protein n=1 Tax=Streptomyces sp. MNU76 TaxID=2560026 RepID=UPI001E29F81B|nr:hypothetical protein [Streptomyces sp. MNU76]MCC9705397.1 hypothetical protein [Streptomyces sp. MNU76]
MPSSPQHPARSPRDVSGADAEALALYREKFRRRLPESLDELHGPPTVWWICRCSWPGPG